MKLKNKKTGEIIDGGFVLTYYDGIAGNPQHSLAELNEEWEDVPEEPKGYWYITHNGTVGCFEYDDDWQYMDFNWQNKLKQIGNYFETKEEAELAVRKLKAWKRLKDKGFRFTGINDDEDSQELITQCGILCEADIYHLEKDADFLLIFGGEE